MSDIAQRDPNRVTGLQGVSTIDSATPTNVAVNPTNNGLVINLGNTLVTKPYDYIGADLSGSTTDIYTFYQGGSGGTLIATVTLTYTDSTKATLQSVAKT